MSFVLSGVTYSYPRAGQPALRAANLDIPAGKTTVLLGPSGSGKSTLMSLLGLLWEGRLDTGQIRYDNGHMYDYARLSHVERVNQLLREIGVAKAPVVPAADGDEGLDEDDGDDG